MKTYFRIMVREHFIAFLSLVYMQTIYKHATDSITERPNNRTGQTHVRDSTQYIHTENEDRHS